ncbi:hypothetical protein ACI79P_19730 [Blastococcus sp. SYSU DS0510]
MGKLLNGTEQAWCDDLLLRLRLRDVPGTRIGEVLAEVQSHVAETGEHRARPSAARSSTPTRWQQPWASAPPARSPRCGGR